MLKKQLQEARYEIEVLDIVLNLDFKRPRKKAMEEAEKNGIDLHDPLVIAEFKKIQTERLNDLRKKKNPEFKPKKTDEEFLKETEEKAEKDLQKLLDASETYNEVKKADDEEQGWPGWVMPVVIGGVGLWLIALLYLFTV